jgi:hypothetical protein
MDLHNKEKFAHELTHVRDNRTSPMIGPFGATWIGGGAADELTKYVGGNPEGLRWTNGTCNIPQKYQWNNDDPSLNYGNHSTADYFAKSFAWTIYDQNVLPQRTIVNEINNMISLVATGDEP